MRDLLRCLRRAFVTEPLTPSLERAREELEKSGTLAKLVTFAAWRAHNGPDAGDQLQGVLVFGMSQSTIQDFNFAIVDSAGALVSLGHDRRREPSGCRGRKGLLRAMALIQFVQNYEDLSTDKGFQFKFHCDKCHNGFMTRFQASALGIAESALHVAGNLFGGFFNAASNSAYEVQRAIGGKAHDAALEEAVLEGKQHFHQCSRCGKWVCPEVCWNAQAGLCEGCAPNFQEEMAAGQAQAKAEAALEQLRQKAKQTDYVADVDMGAKAVLGAPGPATAAADRCVGCGASIAEGARFCPQCGAPRRAPDCAGCGAAIQPNTKFCAQCGAKIV